MAATAKELSSASSTHNEITQLDPTDPRASLVIALFQSRLVQKGFIGHYSENKITEDTKLAVALLQTDRVKGGKIYLLGPAGAISSAKDISEQFSDSSHQGIVLQYRGEKETNLVEIVFYTDKELLYINKSFYEKFEAGYSVANINSISYPQLEEDQTWVVLVGCDVPMYGGFEIRGPSNSSLERMRV